MSDSGVEAKADALWDQTTQLLAFFNVISQLPRYGQMAMIGNNLNCLIHNVNKIPGYTYDEITKRIIFNPVNREILQWSDFDYFHELYGSIELCFHLVYSILEIISLTANRIDNTKYKKSFRESWKKSWAAHEALKDFDSSYRFIAEIRTEWSHYSGFCLQFNHDKKEVSLLLTAFRQSSKDKQVHTDEKEIGFNELDLNFQNIVLLIQALLVLLFLEFKDTEKMDTNISVYDSGIKGKSTTGLYLGPPDVTQTTIGELIQTMNLDKITAEVVAW